MSGRGGNPPEAFPGDDDLLHLGGTVSDLDGHDIAEALLETELLRVTVVAVQQQAVLDCGARDQWAVPFGHRRLRRVRALLVAQPQGGVAEQTGCLEGRAVLREREGHPLE